MNYTVYRDSGNRRTYALFVLIFILPKSTQLLIFTLFPCLWLASNSVNVKIKTKPRCASLLCNKNGSAKLRSSVSALPSHTQVQRSAQLVSISTSSTSLTLTICPLETLQSVPLRLYNLSP